ncbi:hypothetical protein C0J52_24399 [Blattella germanica]|nr:hypothetical protein C0J52_24399 [Blattella germanica]
MNASYTKQYPIRSDDPQSRLVTMIGLELDMDSSTFQFGKLRVQCVATMFQLYREEAEAILEEERPRLASVLGTRESSPESLHVNDPEFDFLQK